MSGDQVKKLDVLSDEIFVNCLKESHCCAVLVSEEQDEPIIVEQGKSGKYCVAFDPLDGSSNIDCNVSTGTIFAVYERITSPDQKATVDDILCAGTAIVCAGYCMYGSATEMVLTFGHGVHRFTLDPTLGEFIHTQGHIQFPANPKTIYPPPPHGHAHTLTHPTTHVVHVGLSVRPALLFGSGPSSFFWGSPLPPLSNGDAYTHKPPRATNHRHHCSPTGCATHHAHACAAPPPRRGLPFFLGGGEPGPLFFWGCMPSFLVFGWREGQLHAHSIPLHHTTHSHSLLTHCTPHP